MMKKMFINRKAKYKGISEPLYLAFFRTAENLIQAEKILLKNEQA